jgi:hypothetical protein
MKKSTIAVVISLIVVALAGITFLLLPLPATDRAMQLSLDYYPNKDAFEVRLRNQAPHRIRVTVNESDYYGSIWIVNRMGERKEYFIERYLLILRTGIPAVPVITMNRAEEVVWTIPRISLRGVHDEIPSLDELDEATIYAESGEIVPMPNGGNGLRSAETKCRIGSSGVISSRVPHHPAYGSVQGGSNQFR